MALSRLSWTTTSRRKLEAVLSSAIDWDAVNSAFSESVADASYLDAASYIGAVNPDGSDVWWVLDRRRFRG